MHYKNLEHMTATGRTSKINAVTGILSLLPLREYQNSQVSLSEQGLTQGHSTGNETGQISGTGEIHYGNEINVLAFVSNSIPSVIILEYPIRPSLDMDYRILQNFHIYMDTGFLLHVLHNFSHRQHCQPGIMAIGNQKYIISPCAKPKQD